ncbi:MAG: transglutaminase domain-containing protein [Firmicutes bacterium]|nr:transglutaminase domain-containing protein [Bacillota bacterium]
MRKRFQKCISMALIVAFLVCVLPMDMSYGALSEVHKPAEVTTFKSTQNFDEEYLRAYVTEADDRILKVIYRTPLETSMFRLSLYRVGANKGDINLNIFITPRVQSSVNGETTYNFTYYLDMDAYDIPDGYYNIYIRRCATPLDAANLKYTNSGVLNKNMEIRVKNGHVKIMRYMDVINYNREIMAIGAQYDTSRYLDNTLEDIRFVLRNPSTNVYASMTSDKVSYMKTISDRVTAGAYTNYEKLRAIYEYAAKNFYYDKVAFQTHSNQYADPYDNIYNFENSRSSANSYFGKVYTTCQGYSAIVIALARAQGIPARLVYGHRLAVPSNDWLTEKNIDVRDHWWVEAYVDGRWIFIDPTVGTTNAYTSTTKKWTYTGITNYTYFDPSEEQIATSHVYMNIYPDYRYGKYIDNDYEISTLGAFLNGYSQVDPDSDDYAFGSSGGQIQNGKMLNSAYNFQDKETWGDGTKSHFMTDGRGNVSQIQWSNYGFTGELSLPAFRYMTLLSSHGNNYTKVDLSGCTKLGKVFLYGNEIQTLDLSNCKSLWYVRAQNNPMKYVDIYVNGSNRSFEAGANGTFYFTLDTRYTKSALSLYAKPDIGYKLKGIYSDTTGNLLSTKSTWHFTPAASGYELRFTLDPNSYKYTLYPGDGQSSRIPYIQAAAKRLAALGYYNPSTSVIDSGSSGISSVSGKAGTETTYNDAMVEAVKKFQVVNDLSNTGNLAKQTWATLFSQDALPMVSETDYPQVLENYKARKAAEAEAKNVMGAVSISANTSVGKGYIKLKWQAALLPTGDPSTDMAISIALPQDASLDDYFDGYEVWKSIYKTTGFEKVFDTTKNSYKNTSGLKKGVRYYYKVRAYKQVGSKKIYSDWSNITYRTAK